MTWSAHFSVAFKESEGLATWGASPSHGCHLCCGFLHMRWVHLSVPVLCRYWHCSTTAQPNLHHSTKTQICLLQFLLPHICLVLIGAAAIPAKVTLQLLSQKMLTERFSPEKSRMTFSSTNISVNLSLKALLVIKDNNYLKLDISCHFVLLEICENRKHNFFSLWIAEITKEEENSVKKEEQLSYCLVVFRVRKENSGQKGGTPS